MAPFFIAEYAIKFQTVSQSVSEWLGLSRRWPLVISSLIIMDHKAIARTGLHGQGHTRHGSDRVREQTRIRSHGAHPVHGIRDRSRGERSIGPDQFGIRQRTLGKNTKTNRHKNLGMAEAPLPVAAINGKGRTARGERAARPAGRGFRVWDSNFNVSFEASPQGYQGKGNQHGYPFHQSVLFF